MRLLKRLFYSSTARQSVIFYVGNFVINLGNYAFHFLLLKLISPSEYGEFASYLSLLYLLTIPSSAISIMVTKQVADYVSQGQNDKLNSMFGYLVGKSWMFSLVLFGLLLLGNPLLVLMFDVERGAIYILAISIFPTIVSSIVNAYILGQQRFKTYIVVGIVGMMVKLITAYLLIILGYRVMGAVLSIFVAMIVAMIGAIVVIKSTVWPAISSKTKFRLRSLASYAFVYSSASLALITVDVLLVRYFFSPLDSGLYASIMTLSKTIYFGTLPLTLLVIPIISRRANLGLSTGKIFGGIWLVVAGIGGMGILMFGMFPTLLIRILAGEAYLAGQSLLVPAGITMLLFSLNVMVVNYFMALSLHRIIWGLLLGAILQPIVIGFFHGSILGVVYINMMIQVGLILGNGSWGWWLMKRTKGS